MNPLHPSKYGPTSHNGISDVHKSISILTRSLIYLWSLSSYLYQLLIKLIKCSLMTQEQHSNSYIYTPFLGDVTAVILLHINSRIYGVSIYERSVTRTSYIREHT